jgi:hypothetical protein
MKLAIWVAMLAIGFCGSALLEHRETRLALSMVLNPQVWSSDPAGRLKQLESASVMLRQIEEDWKGPERR